MTDSSAYQSTDFFFLFRADKPDQRYDRATYPNLDAADKVMRSKGFTRIHVTGVNASATWYNQQTKQTVEARLQ